MLNADTGSMFDEFSVLDDMDEDLTKAPTPPKRSRLALDDDDDELADQGGLPGPDVELAQAQAAAVTETTSPGERTWVSFLPQACSSIRMRGLSESCSPAPRTSCRGQGCRPCARGAGADEAAAGQRRGG